LSCSHRRILCVVDRGQSALGLGATDVGGSQCLQCNIGVVEDRLVYGGDRFDRNVPHIERVADFVDSDAAGGLSGFADFGHGALREMHILWFAIDVGDRSLTVDHDRASVIAVGETPGRPSRAACTERRKGQTPG
jgi:hypothetical protein